MSNYNDIVSIVIPSKNEAHKIYKCLDAIKTQSVRPKEVIVIDSGSTDGTQELVKKYEDVKLIEIPPSEFNHGGTRNLGVKHATGEYVLFTVQDAWACDNDWIKKHLDVFSKHDVVAVGGSQAVPHDKSTNPAEWFRPQSVPVVSLYKFAEGEYDRLEPAERKRVAGLDNVNTMYKRQALVEYPFPHVMEGEDGMWARDMYRRGFALALNPAARVYHSHVENRNYFYKRALLNAYLCYTEFEYVRPVPKLTLKQVLVIFKLIARAENLTPGERVKWLRYNFMVENTIRRGITDFNNLLANGSEELEKKCQFLIKKGLERV